MTLVSEAVMPSAFIECGTISTVVRARWCLQRSLNVEPYRQWFEPSPTQTLNPSPHPFLSEKILQWFDTRFYPNTELLDICHVAPRQDQLSGRWGNITWESRGFQAMDEIVPTDHMLLARVVATTDFSYAFSLSLTSSLYVLNPFAALPVSLSKHNHSHTVSVCKATSIGWLNSHNVGKKEEEVEVVSFLLLNSEKWMFTLIFFIYLPTIMFCKIFVRSCNAGSVWICGYAWFSLSFFAFNSEFQ